MQIDEPIEIVASRPEWSTQYAAEAASLQDALGPLMAAVEHIGSTAVPDLPAKPVVDITIDRHP